MYPLNITRVDGDVTAFACANDEAEHKAMSDAGYLPAFEGETPAEESAPEKRKPGRPRKTEG